MNNPSYVLVDEPRRSVLGPAATDPLWPLLSLMLVGSWFSFGWFVFNAFALGSPRRFGDLLVAAGGIAGSLAIVFLVAVAFGEGWMPERAIPYALLLCVAWKLVFGYLLARRQWPVAELRTWFGGRMRYGVLILAAGYFLARPAYAALQLPSLFGIALA